MSQNLTKNNDLFRTTMITSPRHKIMLTEMVSKNDLREQILTAVRAFSAFTPDNDPYGEHDFGQVIVNNENYFFKIDYYDLNFEYGADTRKDDFARLLTIMHSSEY